MHSDNLYLFGVFRPLSFKVIIDSSGLIATHICCYFVFIRPVFDSSSLTLFLPQNLFSKKQLTHLEILRV